MHIRVSWRQAVAYLPPVLMLIVSLVMYPSYWEPSGSKQVEPAASLIIVGIMCTVMLVLSYSTLMRELLSQSFWARMHHVKSSPGQAQVAVIVLRVVALFCLWAIGILAIIGRG